MYLICTFPSKQYDINDFPAIKDWLINGDWVLPNSPIGTGQLRLEQTGQEYTVSGQKFKSRKKTNNEWFETQDSISYSDDFNKPKIIFSRISGNEPCFAYDHAGMMTNDTGYIISGPNIDYLLEKLCSDVYWFAFKVFYMGGGIDKEFKVANLNNLPIPLPGTPEIKFSREELDFILKSLQ